MIVLQDSDGLQLFTQLKSTIASTHAEQEWIMSVVHMHWTFATAI